MVGSVLEKFADLDVVVTNGAMQSGDFAMEECQFVVGLSISFVEYLGHGLMPAEEKSCDRCIDADDDVTGSTSCPIE